MAAKKIKVTKAKRKPVSTASKIAKTHNKILYPQKGPAKRRGGGAAGAVNSAQTVQTLIRMINGVATPLNGGSGGKKK